MINTIYQIRMDQWIICLNVDFKVGYRCQFSTLFLCVAFNPCFFILVCRIPVDTSASSRDQHCVVPENIHTPTTEGIGNSKGEGGSKTHEIPEGRGIV